ALFYGAHRIRAPAEPVVVVLAAVGILTLIDRRRVQPVPMEPPEADDDPTPQSVGPVPLWPSR
nr:hypothetical protein [Acidimicrobiia bacterium]